jgi:hypothetical protein
MAPAARFLAPFYVMELTSTSSSGALKHRRRKPRRRHNWKAAFHAPPASLAAALASILLLGSAFYIRERKNGSGTGNMPRALAFAFLPGNCRQISKF